MAVTFTDIFTDPESWPAQDAVLRSTSITPEVTILAYRYGLFPMPITEPGAEPWMWWWSPLRRGVVPLNAMRVTRSLRQSAKKYRVTVDRAFEQVITRCADPARDGGWIDDRIVDVYTYLHRHGRAHSVEAWTRDGQLAGGLYGVSLGGLFAGESMFHDPEVGRDASKVALLALGQRLRAAGDAERRLLDVQWLTDHLATQGAIEIPRTEYLRRLVDALKLPEPDWSSQEIPDA